MPLEIAVPPPPAGVAGLVLVKNLGNVYLHWQDANGTISPTYAMTFQNDPDGNGIRGVLYNDIPPQFKKDEGNFFYVIEP